MMFLDRSFNERFFRRVIARPVLTLLAATVVFVASAAGLTRLVKDTSVEAFIPDGHPSVLANDRSREVFGISKPIAVAVMTRDGRSVFNAETLALVRELSARLEAVPNVRRDRIVSIATESSIAGDGASILVERYVPEAGVITPAQAADARERWRAMPPHVDALVSNDETGAVVMAELVDDALAADTYRRVLALSAKLEGPGHELLVAGPGAVSGYLSEYIDRDARKLQPLVFLVVLAFIWLAFRRTAALVGPLLVIAGAAGGALGLMAWSGTPYFAITNALPVIIVAISVADAIHILSAYYALRAGDQAANVGAQVVAAMGEMARPITLTTLTTMAGFAGIGIASIMPPVSYFAWFAMVGVALAWVFSILILPNVLVLLKPKPSPAFTSWRRNEPDVIGRTLAGLGLIAARRPVPVLAVFALVLCAAAIGAAQLRVDRSQVENFAADEPLRLADERINAHFAGTSFLDVMVRAEEPGGLLTATAMEEILELQRHFESLPHVQKTVSIADYLGLLHGAVEGTGSTRDLPEAEDAIAQYLFLYEVSGDPTDFEEEIDTAYQTALVRGVLNDSHFSRTRGTVEALERYTGSELGGAGLSAELAGDVNIGYHWMSRLQSSHFLSVGLSLAMVLLIAALTFRATWAGLIAIVPVTASVLALYGVMGWTGVFLEPATSMFAAISVGVGVDFAIHLLERLRRTMAGFGDDLERVVRTAVPSTARACFFNALALGVGFAVLLTSELPTLKRFGGLVTVAAFSSFLAALVVVPALFALVQRAPGRAMRRASGPAVRNTSLAVLFGCALVATDPAHAQQTLGHVIAERVAERPVGDASRRTLHITLTPRRGRAREREAVVLTLNAPDGRRTRITYVEPRPMRNTSFLSHDAPTEASADDRWLFIPATRRVRRLPAAERGKSFLGTDFSYEDMQSELKFDLSDYRFEHLGREETAGGVRHRIAGEPRSEQIARELGYGGFTAVVDETTWMPMVIGFDDEHGERLKTVTVEALEQIDGVWTATHVTAENHQTGHRTSFRFEDIVYEKTLPETIFQPSSLQRGLRGL